MEDHEQSYIERYAAFRELHTPFSRAFGAARRCSAILSSVVNSSASHPLLRWL
jgi:hypothetical protein